MRLLWLGAVLLTMVWLFALPLGEPPHWMWAGFLILGVAASSLAFRGLEFRPAPKAYAALFLPLTLYTAVTPWPHNLGAIVVMVALLAALSARRNRYADPAVLGAGFSGLALLAQAIAWPAYEHVAARLHNFPLLNPVFAFLVNLLGGSASYGNDSIFIKTASGVSQLYTTWEVLGAFPLLNVLLTGGLLLMFFERVWDRLTRFFIIVMAYAIIRYIFLLFAFSSFGTSDILWRRPWTVISFLPLAFVLMKFLPLKTDAQEVTLPIVSFDRRTATVLGAGSLAIVALASALLFQDPGVRKPGRVLFDESHSNWEWMERPYDTEWYGEQSGYNYFSLGQYLKHYYETDIGKEPLTPELLSNYDVVVLKTPTDPYTPDEIRTVVDFVNGGGGLWLIGDHTNVFGMGAYLNDVASQFGFAFKYDATYDLATGNLSFYEPPQQLRHPVTGSVPFYLFATSCSLEAPLVSEDVIIGYGLKAARADYSQRSFFPKEAHSSTAIEYGLFVQNGGAKFGDGRVLLYTDSTCFSNFYMFMPGKPELVLGSIEWLNRKNRFRFVSLLLLVLSLASSAVAVALIRKKGRDEIALIVFTVLLLGAPIGVLGIDAINRLSYPRPQPHSPYPVVAFEAEHSNYYLPAKQFGPGDRPDMQTFYVWTQRLGIVPEVRYKFADSLKGSNGVVIINPSRDFTEQEVAEFVRYVENGGNVLLMDDPRNRSSSAHQLLQPFNVKIVYQEIPEGNVEDEQGNLIWPGHHLGIVAGGNPVLFLKPIVHQPVTPAGGMQPDSKKDKSSRGKIQQPNANSSNAASDRKAPSAVAKNGNIASQREAGNANAAEIANAAGNRNGKLGRARNGQAALGKDQANQNQKMLKGELRAPVLSVVHRGLGALAVMANSTIFTGQVMGATGTVPDENRRKIYNLEYRIFRDILKVAADAQAQVR